MMNEAWIAEWSGRHTDAWHGGPRETCTHCQEMIKWYGPMPPKEVLQNYRPSAAFRGPPKYQKQVITHRIRKAVFERDAYRCQKCGDWHDLSVDHIVPESKGGTLALENLQTLCRSCNSRKGSR